MQRKSHIKNYTKSLYESGMLHREKKDSHRGKEDVVIAGCGLEPHKTSSKKHRPLTVYSLHAPSFPTLHDSLTKAGDGGGRYINTTKYEGCQLSFSPGIYNWK
jgi:hypothetical protein